MFKAIANFFRTKTIAAVNNCLSPEDQYARAADMIINQITDLRKRRLTAVKEASNLRTKAKEKLNQKSRKDAEILHLMSRNIPVETHARLAILYARTADAMEARAVELDKMIVSIEEAVVALDDRRQELAAKLEYMREAKLANDMGIDTDEDVMTLAGLTEVKVDDILMRVDTFSSEDPHTSTATSVEVEEYLRSLKG